MVDSDVAEAGLPPDGAISRTLQHVVIALHKAGNTDDLTVKRVRARAEEELGLPAGFLKTNANWKQRSNGIIHEAVEKYCGDDPDPVPNLAAPEPTKPKPATKKSKPTGDDPRGVKRKAPDPAKKAQKRRKASVSDEDLKTVTPKPPVQNEVQSVAESKPSKKIARRPNRVVAEDSEEEDGPSDTGTKKVTHVERDGSDDESTRASATAGSMKKPTEDAKGVASESEMSSLLDESPVKKKRQKKSPPLKASKANKAKESKATKARAKPSKAQDDDPDLAEIKRLQGWLVKCGIRKVWSKELAKCDTSKEKIKHLRSMLKDAGMEGKFSNEKAARIKEQREFAKDLEAIQEGERLWGKVEDADEGERPKRRATRGIRNIVIEDEEDEGEAMGKDEDADDGKGGEDDDEDDEGSE